VDTHGKLAYHGAYDDRKAPDKTGETNYVAKALDALLAGEKVEKPVVKAWGCTIKRAPKPMASTTPGNTATPQTQTGTADVGPAGSGSE